MVKGQRVSHCMSGMYVVSVCALNVRRIGTVILRGKSLHREMDRDRTDIDKRKGM